ncbi:MAG TPA: hypothetical protein VGZ52_01335 [Acidimicrobiales bacterium]|jgi:hypothetical protein|nr:hypothetical protein [Acidimicrobiales bacterium]
MAVLLAVVVIVVLVAAPIAVWVRRGDGFGRQVAEFDAGLQALRRASMRSPRSTL